MKEPQDCETLDEIRLQIDRLDRSLITTIARRREYVHADARFKRSPRNRYMPASASAACWLPAGSGQRTKA